MSGHVIYTNRDNELYLAHYGILGQKWGVRRFQNYDGTLTNEGKTRYYGDAKYVNEVYQNNIYEVFDKTSASDDVSNYIFNILDLNKKHLKRAEEALDENSSFQKKVTKAKDDLFRELESDEKLHSYEALSELADWASYLKKDVDDCTLEDLGDTGFLGVLEDGQQGNINAYSVYTLENNLENKVSSLLSKSIESTKKSRNLAEKYISDALVEAGAENLKPYRNGSSSLADAITFHMANSKEFKDDISVDGSYYLSDAYHAKSFSDQDKSNIKKAKNYVLKIDECNDEDTWYYVYEAADNLGLSSSKLKDLSQSDWDKINAEISDLKAFGHGALSLDYLAHSMALKDIDQEDTELGRELIKQMYEEKHGDQWWLT